MNTPELERRVADVLKKHAEAAMTSTDTDQAKLDGIRADAERAARKRRLAWGAGGALVGAAAASVVVWAMGLTSATPDTTGPASPRPTTPEQVATAFVDAYGGYDRPLLKSLLAGNALAEWTSLDQDNRGYEAMEFRVLLDRCTAMNALGGPGIQVSCPFDAHAIGSEQLGRGPWRDNSFWVRVLDGKIVEWDMNFAFNTNGFNVQMWEPFVAWVTQHYPKDVPRMIDSNSNVLPGATSSELWHRHIADYVAAKSS